MSKIKFKHTVLHATQPLIQHGYLVDESGSDAIRFLKSPVTGVRCIIEFQLLPNFIPPSRLFNVWLFRVQLPDFPGSEQRYLPLAISLPNLMAGFYNLRIFPPEKYYWEFTEEQSLAEQITQAQSLLVDYGIRWLEDPASNIEWVRHHKSQP